MEICIERFCGFYNTRPKSDYTQKCQKCQKCVFKTVNPWKTYNYICYVTHRLGICSNSDAFTCECVRFFAEKALRADDVHQLQKYYNLTLIPTFRKIVKQIGEKTGWWACKNDIISLGQIRTLDDHRVLGALEKTLKDDKHKVPQNIINIIKNYY